MWPSSFTFTGVSFLFTPIVAGKSPAGDEFGPAPASEGMTALTTVGRSPRMPKVESFPAGAPCWVELFTSDTQRSRSFYGELFGWTSQDMGPDYGGYINFF